MQFPGDKILIFARAPVPGACKTRLIPALGAVGAAALSERLLVRLLARLEERPVAPVILCCTPDVDHPAFARHQGERWRQEGADLGERMANAARRALETGSRVLLIGTDCPLMESHYLSRAFEALDEVEVVIGPAEDGGYVLLGLRRFHPGLFRGIEWGSHRVLAQTLARIDALGWRHRRLETLWDLDRPEDLQRLRMSSATALLPK